MTLATDTLLQQLAAKHGVHIEIAYPAHDAEWYLELLQADTEQEQDANERAADAEWLASDQQDWGFTARRTEFVGTLAALAYGDMDLGTRFAISGGEVNEF
jgi:hypothetical protein